MQMDYSCKNSFAGYMGTSVEDEFTLGGFWQSILKKRRKKVTGSSVQSDVLVTERRGRSQSRGPSNRVQRDDYGFDGDLTESPCQIMHDLNVTTSDLLALKYNLLISFVQVIADNVGDNAGDIVGNLGWDLTFLARVFCGPSSNYCTSELETDDEEVTTVVFSPDHMAYQDKYCADCVLTFTSSCIKIEGSFLDDDEEPFRLHWGIEDILCWDS
ncbi:hypothetical protein Tco_0485118 [Tanacetum coccineum]